MKIQTDISISRPSDSTGEKYIEVRLKDDASHITFATVKVGLADFMEALTGLAHMECETEVRGLEYVGKVREREQASVFISENEYRKITDGLKYYRHTDVLGQWLIDNHSREGWMVDTYLGSQSSIKNVEGGKMLNFSYFRYVEQKDE